MTLAAKAGLSVVAEGMRVSVPDGRGGPEHKTLLENVSFRIEPKDSPVNGTSAMVFRLTDCP